MSEGGSGDYDQYCPPSHFALAIIHSTLSLVLTIISILAYRQFTSQHTESLTETDRTSTKWNKRFMKIFIICSIGFFPSWSIYTVGDCYKISSNINMLVGIIFGLTYNGQSFLLMVIFFDKVHQIFKKSAFFTLSPCTTRSFRAFFIFIIFWFCVNIVANGVFRDSIPDTISYAMVTSMILLFSAGNLSLLILFVTKLVTVYKSLSETQNESEIEFLLKPITRVTILSAISIFTTFINGIGWIIHGIVFTHYTEWMMDYITTMDIFTNFLCIILSNNLFEKPYQMLCSCVHRNCQMCWTNIVTNKGANDNKVGIEMQMKRESEPKLEPVETNTIDKSKLLINSKSTLSGGDKDVNHLCVLVPTDTNKGQDSDGDTDGGTDGADAFSITPQPTPVTIDKMPNHRNYESTAL